MSRSNLLKMLLLSFVIFITFNLFSVPSYAAFKGQDGEHSYYLDIYNGIHNFADKERYQKFYNSFKNSSSTVFDIDYDELSDPEQDLTYVLDFQPNSYFYKCSYSTEFLNLSVNHCSGNYPINYSHMQNFESFEDGHVTFLVIVKAGVHGTDSIRFLDESGSSYDSFELVPLEEQTFNVAYKDKHGDFYLEPDEKPDVNPPVIKPPDGGLDSFPIDDTSTDTVIESLIEGLKTFFSWLLKFLVPIICGAVALGVIVKGAIWLWRKAKNWVFNS